MIKFLLNKVDGLSAIQRSILSAILGFILYASWGYWVNLMHGESLALKAALVQGSYSFILTFLTTLLIESIFSAVEKIVANSFLLSFSTILISCLIVFSGSWWVNVLANTPEIFDTVILGYILGGIYTLVYVVGLTSGRGH